MTEHVVDAGADEQIAARRLGAKADLEAKRLAEAESIRVTRENLEAQQARQLTETFVAARAAHVPLVRRGSGRVAQVGLERFLHRRVDAQLAGRDQQAALAERGGRGHVVRDEQHRPSAAADLLHLAEAFLLKGDTPDCDPLVDEQDLALEMRGHREREPHVHAARVVLDGRVDEARELGELDDRLAFAAYLRALQAEYRSVEEDVFSAGQIGMEAGANLEEAGDPAAQLDPA